MRSNVVELLVSEFTIKKNSQVICELCEMLSSYVMFYSFTLKMWPKSETVAKPNCFCIQNGVIDKVETFRQLS